MFKIKFLSIAFILMCTLGINSSAQVAADLVFQIDVTIQESPAAITLDWHTLPNVSTYRVLRKARSSSTWTTLAANIPQTTTTFTDNSVAIGSSYEYAVMNTSNDDVSGYVYAGVKVPAVHSNGRIIVLVDDTYQTDAAAELETFKRDLIKEGWSVSLQYVSRAATVNQVKNTIKSDFLNDPVNTKGVIILGHLAVPYSGNMAPDGHVDHIGAWPADYYYADMSSSNSTWTDIQVNSLYSSDARNHNLVADGKYDLTNKPAQGSANPKIFVGRVDVYDMPTINPDDKVLFKQYLNKNHEYRAGVKKYVNKAILKDGFGWFQGEAFAQNGWRNMSSLIGKQNVTAGPYVQALQNESMIWSYACGGGWHTGCSGVATTTTYKNKDLNTVFTMQYGSYFGDWDKTNNYLRAPIAGGDALVNIWGGRPNWFLHTMSLGEPIGYGYLNTVENVNTYFPKGAYSTQIHNALLGDPSLKMHMIEAPKIITAVPVNGDSQIQIDWTPSAEANIEGYYVYRASNIDGQFTLLTQNPINSTSFTDTNPPSNKTANMSTYMVKAVRLEQAVTGSFYNLSPGIVIESFSSSALPVNVTSFTGVKNNDGTNSLRWSVQDEENLHGYELQRSVDQVEFETVGHLTAKNTKGENSYIMEDEDPHASTFYRLKTIDIDGQVNFHSNIVHLSRSIDIDGAAYVFPNPATEQMTFVYDNKDEEVLLSIEIIDMAGRTLQQNSSIISRGSSSMPIDLGGLAAGNYVLRYATDVSKSANLIKFTKKQ